MILTGNWTYFVGNLDGRSVQVKDFSTYGQNSEASMNKRKKEKLPRLIRSTDTET